MNSKIRDVCIIDDDAIFVFAAKKIMQHSNVNFCFVEFSNGQEALDYLKPRMEKNENIPELILLDLNMPVMDGWQFLDEFIKIKYSPPITIYIVSSSIMSIDTDRAKEYDHVSNYIIKPVTYEMLTQIVENSFKD